MLKTFYKSNVFKRQLPTAEVVVSKVAPAGFCWQGSSILADNIGMVPTDINFFMATGFGEGIGVFVGHNIYNLIKKNTFDETINMKESVHSGIWLSSAAFCSGFAWQPIVNLWQLTDSHFNVVFINTWIGCGIVFFTGLRVGRIAFPFIENGNNANLIQDITLSSAIGGATGTFVGTDILYRPHENWLTNVVDIGIQQHDSTLLSCGKAGLSTGCGFFVTQNVLNFTAPPGKLWND